jgi:hypothetical protein
MSPPNLQQNYNSVDNFSNGEETISEIVEDDVLFRAA